MVEYAGFSTARRQRGYCSKAQEEVRAGNPRYLKSYGMRALSQGSCMLLGQVTKPERPRTATIVDLVRGWPWFLPPLLIKRVVGMGGLVEFSSRFFACRSDMQKWSETAISEALCEPRPVSTRVVFAYIPLECTQVRSDSSRRVPLHSSVL